METKTLTRVYDLEERLVAFAVMVLELCEKMPDTFEGRYFRGQLTRSASSPALNYGEARVAESKRDFTHKMRICLKELKETQVCLKIIQLRKHQLDLQKLETIRDECGQLVAIFISSIRNKTE